MRAGIAGGDRETKNSERRRPKRNARDHARPAADSAPKGNIAGQCPAEKSAPTLALGGGGGTQRSAARAFARRKPAQTTGSRSRIGEGSFFRSRGRGQSPGERLQRRSPAACPRRGGWPVRVFAGEVSCLHFFFPLPPPAAGRRFSEFQGYNYYLNLKCFRNQGTGAKF